MSGYWKRPEETAAVMKNGEIFTGDAGYMDKDGFVYIVDRLKDMIITGGENIFSAEVENVISMYPGVSKVAVIGVPDKKWGEAVHAIVIPESGKDLCEQEIINFCKKSIAGYKVPRSVAFRTDPFPLSGTGKVLKKDLRSVYWRGREKNVS